MKFINKFSESLIKFNHEVIILDEVLINSIKDLNDRLNVLSALLLSHNIKKKYSLFLIVILYLTIVELNIDLMTLLCSFNNDIMYDDPVGFPRLVFST